MECTINWVAASGMTFMAETGSGHVLTMDGAPDGGGRNLAPRPMETVLAGTGGCTAYDVVLILKRGRHDVRGEATAIGRERAGKRAVFGPVLVALGPFVAGTGTAPGLQQPAGLIEHQHWRRGVAAFAPRRRLLGTHLTIA